MARPVWLRLFFAVSLPVAPRALEPLFSSERTKPDMENYYNNLFL
ncbi:MAG: hypothetical protein ACRER2_11575 [Methylococcales bacterium]